MSNLPGISILLPTLNAERYLTHCLQSIRDQDYPSELLEILVADAGSQDTTLQILNSYGIRNIVPNPGVTGEAARAILNRLASRELILSLDSDNYLVGSDWLRRLAEPLMRDSSVFASEPIRWDYVQQDPPLNRYFALSGVNDPVSLFMGNYGRFSYFTGVWTQMPHNEEQHEGYVVIELEPGRVPTMGANGFLARTDVIRAATTGDYYFDIDVVCGLVMDGHRRIAKVDIALGHRFADNLPSFRRKTRRRIEDFLFWREQRRYPWLSSGRRHILRFAVATLLVVPLCWQIIRGFMRVRDPAWLYHLPVCWFTLWLYSVAVVHSVVRRAPYSRRGWQH